MTDRPRFRSFSYFIVCLVVVLIAWPVIKGIDDPNFDFWKSIPGFTIASILVVWAGVSFLNYGRVRRDLLDPPLEIKKDSSAIDRMENEGGHTENSKRAG